MALGVVAHAGEAELMRLLLGSVLQGLVSGCIIALLAAGVTLVHRSTRVLNFAQGSFATLSAYLFYGLTVVWHLPAVLALPIVLVASAAFGVAAEAAAIRPLERAEPQVRAAGTIGLVLIVQWLVITIWGAQQRFLPALASGGTSIGGVHLGAQHLIIVGATVVVGVLLALGLGRTRVGLALSASAQDRTAAQLLGVSPRIVSSGTFALAGVVGGIAGVLATPLLVLTPSQMTLVFVVSLGASLAGGFESLPRTVLAGLGLGVLQSVVTAYAPSSSGLSQASGFLAVLIALAVVRRRINLVDVLRGTA